MIDDVRKSKDNYIFLFWLHGLLLHAYNDACIKGLSYETDDNEHYVKIEYEELPAKLIKVTDMTELETIIEVTKAVAA